MKKLLYSIFFLITTGGIAQTSTWQKVTIPTTKDLKCIVFPTPQVGYIGGTDSLLLKTVDGGLTWSNLPYSGITFLPGGDDFMALDFVTDSIGYATVGPYSGTYRTSDGGLTWTQLNTSGTLCYNHGLYFFSDGEGFVGGSGCFQGEQMDWFSLGTMAPTPVTINTPSWQSSDLIVDIDFDLNVFASVGLAVSAGGRILRTTNSGLTWDTIASPLGNQVPLTTISIVNSNLAYAGYDNGSGIGGLLVSTDGGLTWAFDLNSATFYYPIFHDLHTTPLGTTYCGATSTTLNTGLIMESVNSSGWNMYPVAEPIYSMTSYNDTVIWGAGKNGYLVRKGGSNALSVNDLSLEGRIELFPNPTSDFITVRLSKELENSAFHIEVYSSDGRLIRIARPGVKTIPISDLTCGNYIVKVRKGSMVWSTSLVKQ